MNDIWRLDITPEAADAQVAFVNQAMKNLNVRDIRSTDEVLNVLAEAYRLMYLDKNDDKSSEVVEAISKSIAGVVREDIEANFMMYWTVFNRFGRQR